jgi:hypothetical protein
LVLHKLRDLVSSAKLLSDVLQRELIAIVLLTRISVTAFGGPSESKTIVDLHAHASEIRMVLLRHTPIGSKAADVLKFIAMRLERPGDAPLKIDDGPALGPAAEGSHRRGVRTIRVYLGEYYQHLGAVFLSAPMIMHREVSAQWAFDEHDRLIDIFVDKRTGVY